MVDVQALLANPPRLHQDVEGLTAEWRLDDAGALFLDAHLQPAMRTIETGAGVSTIVFALKATRHTCIVPDQGLVQRISQYCTDAGISLRQVDFVVERSEYALPRLEPSCYDLALIDGRHGFPAPFIDWFYIADRLRDGGVVIVDDLQIWTCEVLASFLETAPGWQRVTELPRAAAYVKQHDGAQHAEWNDQPFVYSHSRGASFYTPTNGAGPQPIGELRED